MLLICGVKGILVWVTCINLSLFVSCSWTTGLHPLRTKEAERTTFITNHKGEDSNEIVLCCHNKRSLLLQDESSTLASQLNIIGNAPHLPGKLCCESHISGTITHSIWLWLRITTTIIKCMSQLKGLNSTLGIWYDVRDQLSSSVTGRYWLIY